MDPTLRTLRVVGILISGAWIIFSAMNYESGLDDPHSSSWLRALTLLGLIVGLPVFARLWMAEGRARERADQERRHRRHPIE